MLRLLRQPQFLFASLLIVPSSITKEKKENEAKELKNLYPRPFRDFDSVGAEILNFKPWTGVRGKATLSKDPSSCSLVIHYKELSRMERDPRGFPWNLKVSTNLKENIHLSAGLSDEGQNGDISISDVVPNLDLEIGFQAKGTKTADFIGSVSTDYRGPWFHTDLGVDMNKSVRASAVTSVNENVALGISGEISREPSIDLSCGVRHHDECFTFSTALSKKTYFPVSFGLAFTSKMESVATSTDFKWNGDIFTVRAGAALDAGNNMRVVQRVDVKGNLKETTCVTKINYSVFDDLKIRISGEVQPALGRTAWGLEVQAEYPFE